MRKAAFNHQISKMSFQVPTKNSSTGWFNTWRIICTFLKRLLDIELTVELSYRLLLVCFLYHLLKKCYQAVYQFFSSHLLPIYVAGQWSCWCDLAWLFVMKKKLWLTTFLSFDAQLDTFKRNIIATRWLGCVLKHKVSLTTFLFCNNNIVKTAFWHTLALALSFLVAEKVASFFKFPIIMLPAVEK